MNKFLSVLGFAKKAGKVVLGYDAVLTCMKEGKAKLVFISSDLSPKTAKNINFETEKYNVKLISTLLTMEEISKIIAKKVGVVAITDENFANGLIKHSLVNDENPSDERTN